LRLILFEQFSQSASGSPAPCPTDYSPADFAFFDGVDIAQQSGKPVKETPCLVYAHILTLSKPNQRNYMTLALACQMKPDRENCCQTSVNTYNIVSKSSVRGR